VEAVDFLAGPQAKCLMDSKYIVLSAKNIATTLSWIPDRKSRFGI